MFDEELLRRAAETIELYRSWKLSIATAESCTGGLVAGLLTAVPGSSAVLERGIVTYSNAAKRELLGVTEESLLRYGAVSEEVARAMAEGALKRSHADVSVAITGIAGPGGGTADKPVGLVHLAAARSSCTTLHLRRTYSDIGRDAIRRTSILDALGLCERMATAP